MKRLHEYLDFYLICAICKDGSKIEGRPICMDYADYTESGENEIDIETQAGQIIGLRESEIARIEVIQE